MAEGYIPNNTDVVIREVVVLAHAGKPIYHTNNIAWFYWAFSNLDSSATSIVLGSISSELAPASTYAACPVLSATPPYLPVGTLWISSTGTVELYKNAGETHVYASTSYIKALANS